MKEIKRPRGPTGNPFEDWGANSLTNLKRKIKTAADGVGHRSDFVTQAELTRIWDMRFASLDAPTETDIIVNHAIGLIDNRLLKRKSRVTRAEIAAQLRARVGSSDQYQDAFLTNLADRLDGKLKRPRGRIPLSPLQEFFDAYVALPVFKLERERLKSMTRKDFHAFRKEHDLSGSPSEVAMEILSRNFYGGMDIEFLRMRLRKNRKH